MASWRWMRAGLGPLEAGMIAASVDTARESERDEDGLVSGDEGVGPSALRMDEAVPDGHLPRATVLTIRRRVKEHRRQEGGWREVVPGDGAAHERRVAIGPVPMGVSAEQVYGVVAKRRAVR